MIGCILVPLDRSAFAERALAQAVEIAKARGAPLRLVHVWQPYLPQSLDAPPETTVDALELDRRGAADYLRRTAARVRDTEHLVVDSAELDPPVAEAICEDAHRAGAALLVMATHGRTGWSRLWIGSVADAVVRRAELPVLLVRADEEPARAPETGGGRRVLVPLDGSAEAEQIVEPAIDALGGGRTTFVLLHVVPPVMRPEVLPTGEPVMLPDPAATADRAELARGYLERLAERIGRRWPGVDARVEVEVESQPARSIVEAAECADFVAMATHGRGASRLLLGSVPDKVLRGTRASLLMVRQRVAAPTGAGAASAPGSLRLVSA